jgi:hypothetical protein
MTAITIVGYTVCFVAGGALVAAVIVAGLKAAIGKGLNL